MTLACGVVAAVVARCLRGDGRARRGALLGPCRGAEREGLWNENFAVS